MAIDPGNIVWPPTLCWVCAWLLSNNFTLNPNSHALLYALFSPFSSWQNKNKKGCDLPKMMSFRRKLFPLWYWSSDCSCIVGGWAWVAHACLLPELGALALVDCSLLPGLWVRISHPGVLRQACQLLATCFPFYFRQWICPLLKQMIQMNLFMKQKQTHRHVKQIYSYQRGKGVGGGMN